MTQQQNLDYLSGDAEVIAPPAHVSGNAFLQDYAGEYQRSIEDPEGFWSDVASELEWFKPWDRVFRWDYPTFKWFEGAQCNITHNALDRHVNSWRKNKAAFIWLGEDGEERVFTYGRLSQLVNRFANGLRSLGVGKGDRVIIYMPLAPEGVIAMLACARVGAVHSVVYAGFSVGALRDRITDAQAKVVITADVGYRRGNLVDLKGITDEAVQDLDLVQHVIYWQRREKKDLGPKEVDFDDLIASSSPHCDAEVMDSEDPLYILYTSGTTGRPKGVVHVHGGYMVGTYYHLKTFWDIKDDDVFWCTSDIGWVVGHSYIVYGPLIAGATTVFREGAIDYPHPGIAYETIEKYGVNVIFTAPTAVRMLMRYGEEYPLKYDLTSLRFLTCAGEAFEPRSSALGLPVPVRLRPVGLHGRQLVADRDRWPLLGHHGHHAQQTRPCRPPIARCHRRCCRHGRPACYRAQQGRDACPDQALPPHVPHRLRRPRALRPRLGTPAWLLLHWRRRPEG